MFILKMTETQAGEYLLFIQSEATNYTILFTVSIRSKCHLLRGPHSRPRSCWEPRIFPSCSGHNVQVSLNMEWDWLNSLQPSIEPVETLSHDLGTIRISAVKNPGNLNWGPSFFSVTASWHEEMENILVLDSEDLGSYSGSDIIPPLAVA